MKTNFLLLGVLLVHSTAFAGDCEIRTFIAGSEASSEKFRLQPRSNSGSLGDGFTYSVMDRPGVSVLRITDSDGKMSEATGAINSETPVSLSVKDKNGNGKDLRCYR